MAMLLPSINKTGSHLWQSTSTWSVHRKILFVLYDRRKGTGESLVSYYRRTYSHLIPDGVEFLEFDEASGDILKK